MFLACRDGISEAAKALVARDSSLVRSVRVPHPALVRRPRESSRRRGVPPSISAPRREARRPARDGTRDRGYAEMVKLLESRLASLHDALGPGRTGGRGDSRRVTSPACESSSMPRRLCCTRATARSSRPIHWAAMTRQLGLIDELLARTARTSTRSASTARGPFILVTATISIAAGATCPRCENDSARSVRAPGRARAPKWTPVWRRPRGISQQHARAARSRSVARTPRIVLQLGATSAAARAVAECRGRRAPRNGGALARARRRSRCSRRGIAPHGKALYSAVYHRHYDIAKRLLERGAYESGSGELRGHRLDRDPESRSPDARSCSRVARGGLEHFRSTSTPRSRTEISPHSTARTRPRSSLTTATSGRLRPGSLPRLRSLTIRSSPGRPPAKATTRSSSCCSVIDAISSRARRRLGAAADGDRDVRARDGSRSVRLDGNHEPAPLQLSTATSTAPSSSSTMAPTSRRGTTSRSRGPRVGGTGWTRGDGRVPASTWRARPRLPDDPEWATPLRLGHAPWSYGRRAPVDSSLRSPQRLRSRSESFPSTSRPANGARFAQTGAFEAVRSVVLAIGLPHQNFHPSLRRSTSPRGASRRASCVGRAWHGCPR